MSKACYGQVPPRKKRETGRKPGVGKTGRKPIFATDGSEASEARRKGGGVVVPALDSHQLEKSLDFYRKLENYS